MFIPYQSILIPLVKFMQYLKLYGDIPGLVLVHIIYGIPITTLIFRNYYAGISSEIMEARPDRWRQPVGDLPVYHAPAFRAELCGGDYLAVHPGLE